MQVSNDQTLEYVLFHEKPAGLFVAYLKARHLKPELAVEGDVFEIRIKDDLEDSVAEEIEQEYQRLMAMNHALFHEEHGEDEDNFRIATIQITLKDGTTTNAHINPDILGRVMEQIDGDELNEIVSAIVDAVENPDDRTYCQKIRAGDIKFDK